MDPHWIPISPHWTPLAPLDPHWSPIGPRRADANNEPDATILGTEDGGIGQMPPGTFPGNLLRLLVKVINIDIGYNDCESLIY